MVERLSSSSSSPRLIFRVNDGREKFEETFASKLSVGDALSVVVSVAKNHRFIGVGHRVVHGGLFFEGPALVDRKVKEKIRDLFDLAPVHNPINLQGIEFMEKKCPGSQKFSLYFYNGPWKLVKLQQQPEVGLDCLIPQCLTEHQIF